MPRIRVLFVDDAVVIRKLVSAVLDADPDLEVVGRAANGRFALTKIPQVNPDVVVLDVEMPEMDGLETLKVLRERYPSLPVIMFSALTRRGAVATLDALTLGANDYVTKPSKLGSREAVDAHIRTELIPKIKAFGAEAAGLQLATLQARSPVLTSARRAHPPPKHVKIVAIGVSTGGPNALEELMPTIPKDFPVPIVIVQHMPPVFTRYLAERLAARSAIEVQEGVAGMALAPGMAWIAPGDSHMVVKQQYDAVQLGLHQSPPENSCRPAVDVLFRSVARVYGAHTLAVVMTGMGKDGLRGCEEIRSRGGQVIVQDRASSVVWGMPGHVAEAGLADMILPLGQLGPEILRRTQKGQPAPKPTQATF